MFCRSSGARVRRAARYDRDPIATVTRVHHPGCLGHHGYRVLRDRSVHLVAPDHPAADAVLAAGRRLRRVPAAVVPGNDGLVPTGHDQSDLRSDRFEARAAVKRAAAWRENWKSVCRLERPVSLHARARSNPATSQKFSSTYYIWPESVCYSAVFATPIYPAAILTNDLALDCPKSRERSHE
jgi:hypothetical protein